MSENSRVLRNRTVTLTSMMNEKQADVYMRPYGPPPHFRGTPDEDVEDWMRLYERYSTAMKWDDVQRANNLVFVMEGEARQWFATALREATADNPLDTWTQWQAALRRDFAGEHVQDWAFHPATGTTTAVGRGATTVCGGHPSTLCSGKHHDERHREGEMPAARTSAGDDGEGRHHQSLDTG